MESNGTNGSYKKDLGNLLLLFLLYVLQGIPLGLIASIPMILQNKDVPYKEQAKFSLAYWPFSMKLLWAPVVDAIYHSGMGRRKSWLIPMQYLLGIFMLILSYRVDDMLNTLNVTLITTVFFIFSFLTATQDIAVDGWAITMLRRENIGYASICNSVGQTTGYFLGYVVFLALESPDFSNQYLRREPLPTGMLTLPTFLSFWGFVFLIVTTLVWIFKEEKPEVNTQRIGVIKSYLILKTIIMLPSIKTLTVVLLSFEIAFAAADSVSSLKLVEAGVPKDRLAMLAMPLIPIQIILPLYISKYMAGDGNNQMSLFIKAFPIRLIFGIVFAWVVWIAPSFKLPDGSYPFSFYALILATYSANQVVFYSMYVPVTAFYAKISDPLFGGTYMSLLGTLNNLGGDWPCTLSLWLVDPLTLKTCTNNEENDCSTTELAKACTGWWGTCVTLLDGYYVETVFCVIFGIVWFFWGRPTILYLQNLPESAWRVPSMSRRNSNQEIQENNLHND